MSEWIQQNGYNKVKEFQKQPKNVFGNLHQGGGYLNKPKHQNGINFQSYKRHTSGLHIPNLNTFQHS